ncbi:hypothetical protein K5E_08220 [Enterococcus thailandicus]|uniref:Uncharacterized protein n=1 Tax=Enterococcus thailandicus TaxID=417368 RepID=A0A510WBJ6_ENTTH|nr:hypothetical protein ETH01_08560 [Enterococcus thailandicus]GMC02876.1 hypothetical protein K4E_03890 [Enterococcus thailandicus]GMC08683.1 hypothetical protein K5E_08220 [Enterococcus thailandicus]
MFRDGMKMMGDFLLSKLHILMLMLTLVCFFVSYFFNLSGLMMLLFIGIPAILTGYLFAKNSRTK